MGRLQDAFYIYKNLGLEQLLYRALDDILWTSRRQISNIFNLYWGLKGGRQSFTINGISAEFGASKDEGGDNIRSQIRSEFEVIEDLLENIEKDDVFYDIGANIGIFPTLQDKFVLM